MTELAEEEDRLLTQGSWERFLDVVHKEILTEASTTSWHQPRLHDVVTVEVEQESAAGGPCETKTWRLGDGTSSIAGVNIDRCVRTMRRGETSRFKSKQENNSNDATLRLIALERKELLPPITTPSAASVKFTRIALQDGSGRLGVEAGTELRICFSWRFVVVQEHLPKSQESTHILLKGSAAEIESVYVSEQLSDLRRALLHHFGGTVVTERHEKPGEASVLELVLMRGGSPVCAADGKEAFASPAQALKALEVIPEASRGCTAKEATVNVEDGHCTCSAEDWLSGPAGVRVLSDLRAGQRCLVRIPPELFPDSREISTMFSQLPADKTFELEYDFVVLQIFRFEDMSLDRSGRVTKKLIKEGDGSYERPAEGAQLTLSIKVLEESSKAILDERQLDCEAASGRLCSAVEETVLSMQKGEVAEVRCSDPEALVDKELKLSSGGSVLFVLELLDFEKLDIFTSDEVQRVKFCTRRKEVGTLFFQQGWWRRALKRYRCVTSNLGYLQSWKDAGAISQAKALRKTCHLNVAACWLKLEDWREAEQACSFALDDEPENVKALFRRGQALKELREFREAEKMFRKVLSIDNGNKEAAKMLLQMRDSVRCEVAKQKEMFSRMARGIAEKPVEASCESVAEEKAILHRDTDEQQVEAESGEVGPDEDDTIVWAFAISALLLVGASAYFYLRRRR
eukprot:TRINITY_DN86825_c0_g1_i1.p1 TRINITY_DN86825_c0_g1~~TRINITY_DN86825_c0_g1_i1.p1  ORF type:complete len:688 (+),score=183.82 TRINITY_DN86825_c0_g1_i1:30-2093(+)